MSVLLYQMAHSPFCIPISQALEAADVSFERKEIPNWDRGEILRLTGGAFYSVPLLVHDERPIFESSGDSQEIARYVNTTWSAGRLFPGRLDAANLSIVDLLENELEARTFKLVDIKYIPAIADIANRGMVIRHKERRFGAGCVDTWRRDAAKLRAEADALLVRFETTLKHQPFLLGDAPVYADFLLFGILASFTMNGWNELSAAQSAIREWMGRMAAFRWEA